MTLDLEVKKIKGHFFACVRSERGDFLLLFCPNQQHHRPLHFFRHLVTPLLRRHSLLYCFNHETNFQQSIQDLSQGVVILLNLIAQKIGGSLSGEIVIRHRPSAVGSKLLVHACREGRMLDVEQKHTAWFQGLIDMLVNAIQVFQIVQHQIGHHQIVGFLRIGKVQQYIFSIYICSLLLKSDMLFINVKFFVRQCTCYAAISF